MSLLACPFCGQAAESDAYQGFRHIRSGQLRSLAAVYCTDCGAQVSVTDEEEADPEQRFQMAVEKWNRREAPKTP